MPSLSFFRTVLARHSEERPSTAGRLLLSAGGWANGRPFHAHGPALFALLGGAKRWLVRRPNASFAWQSLEVPRESLSGASLPDGWEPNVWQCTQREGELLWVPDQQHHATLNYAAETVGVTMVIDETEPFTPLHAAAQSGAAAAVARLLRDGAEVDAVAVASGPTPLHFAAGLGHCDALEALFGGWWRRRARDVGAMSARRDCNRRCWAAAPPSTRWRVEATRRSTWRRPAGTRAPCGCWCRAGPTLRRATRTVTRLTDWR